MLLMAQFAYNSKDHPSTGMSPFKANYGFDPTWYPKIGEKETNTTGRSWVKRIYNTQKTCLTNLNCVVQTYKAFANQKRISGQSLQVRNKVYLDSHSPPPIQTNRGEEYEVKYIHGNQTHYQKPQYYVKWRGYSLKESTWELLSNLTNAQEAVQLYLNKKNQKEGDPGEEGDDVKIDNSSPLETQAWEQDSNPGPGSLQAAGPMDCWAAHLCFLGIKPLQAEAPVNSQSQNTDISLTIVAPKEEPFKLPNEGRDGAYVSFMSLKSSQTTNQEPTQERGMGLWPGPMTMMLKQDNQVAKSRLLTNERTLRPSAILLLSDPSTQFPRPSFLQCPDEPMENVKFGDLLAPPPAVFCPPGAPFGPVHFTDYPLKPEYKDYTPEKIIKLDPLSHIQSAVRYNRQGLWIFSTPKLFRGKFNYLPAYNVYMEPPVTPKLMPASSPGLPTNHTSKLFGIVYITLTGVVDIIVLAAGPWSWLGKSASYLLNLAPLLWWALPTKNLAQVTSKTGRPAAQEWVPDTYIALAMEGILVRPNPGVDHMLDGFKLLDTWTVM
ncbi:hypothetical protein DSO57_1011562 [Entomophthora muscae]|uniref:Uncharacterized protein n=1 Tax=Entomophthora muscae TaxID=34485 RepID=A0ACC2SV06_9FUNG|nr:hypothetical protein DSO57_1011562 [Entomophthora muscae]